ncbi:hypothetical protein QZH41_011392, partial [Actinostola sp. cb2023]
MSFLDTRWLCPGCVLVMGITRWISCVECLWFSSDVYLGRRLWEFTRSVPAQSISRQINGDIMQLQFVKSALAVNPCMIPVNYLDNNWPVREQNISCRGGLAWWKDFIIVPCFNVHSNSDEVRFYPRNTNLDNAFAVNVKLPAPAFLVNVFRDVLLVYCSDSRVVFYSMEMISNSSS